MSLSNKELDIKSHNSYLDIFHSKISDINLTIETQLSKFNESSLKKAALYSSIGTSGKRIRPILFLETIKLFIEDTKPFLPIAATIELCHVYSLIHDDLPAIDNDDFRRGKLSCHKQFDEATAILTGDALLTYCFEIISNTTIISPEKRCALISELAKSIGQSGMVGGQMLDLHMQKSSYSESDIKNLHNLKTGKLIEFCTISPSIICDATTEQKLAIQKFGESFGLIFQITDDLLDYREKKAIECNIVNSIGHFKTKALLEKLVNEAILSLDIFGDQANILKSLVKYSLLREK